ncbi:MAG TPA: IclR family transcriptional regulator C-terminal domain-containing protein [Anaeromyxobacteraceae bacterium]|nr:IclR family transcriptional regulator C-terminal domain-containing protein [Anaeromyxobacteraceae bacterium]
MAVLEPPLSKLATRSPADRYLIKSLVRGLEVMEVFGGAPRGLTVTEVARAIGCGKGTTFRYLSTLGALGYLEFEAESHRYRPAVRVMRLGGAYLAALSLPELATPHLERLAAAVAESVNMAVLDETEVVYVARVGARRILSTNLAVGSRLPAHCTALGKVLLAYLPADERDRRLAELDLAPLTSKTLTNRARLRQALSAVQRQGYALNDQELDLGLRSCAAPVLDRCGAAVAAINVSVPSAHATLHELETRYVPLLVNTAREVTSVVTTLHRQGEGPASP